MPVVHSVWCPRAWIGVCERFRPPPNSSHDFGTATAIQPQFRVRNFGASVYQGRSSVQGGFEGHSDAQEGELPKYGNKQQPWVRPRDLPSPGVSIILLLSTYECSQYLSPARGHGPKVRPDLDALQSTARPFPF